MTTPTDQTIAEIGTRTNDYAGLPVGTCVRGVDENDVFRKENENLWCWYTNRDATTSNDYSNDDLTATRTIIERPEWLPPMEDETTRLFNVGSDVEGQADYDAAPAGTCVQVSVTSVLLKLEDRWQQHFRYAGEPRTYDAGHDFGFSRRPIVDRPEWVTITDPYATGKVVSGRAAYDRAPVGTWLRNNNLETMLSLGKFEDGWHNWNHEEQVLTRVGAGGIGEMMDPREVIEAPATYVEWRRQQDTYALGQTLGGEPAYENAPNGTYAVGEGAADNVVKIGGEWYIANSHTQTMVGHFGGIPFSPRTIAERPIWARLDRTDATDRFAVGQIIGTGNYEDAPVGTFVSNSSNNPPTAGWLKRGDGLWHHIMDGGVASAPMRSSDMTGTRQVAELPAHVVTYEVGQTVEGLEAYQQMPVGTAVSHSGAGLSWVKTGVNAWRVYNDNGRRFDGSEEYRDRDVCGHHTVVVNPCLAVETTAAEVRAQTPPVVADTTRTDEYREQVITAMRTTGSYQSHRWAIEGMLIRLGLVEPVVGMVIPFGSIWALPQQSIVRIDRGEGMWSMWTPGEHDGDVPHQGMGNPGGNATRVGGTSTARPAYNRDVTIVGVGQASDLWVGGGSDAEVEAAVASKGREFAEEWQWCEESDRVIAACRRPSRFPPADEFSTWPTWGKPVGTVVVNPEDNDVFILTEQGWRYCNTDITTEGMTVLDGSGREVRLGRLRMEETLRANAIPAF